MARVSPRRRGTAPLAALFLGLTAFFAGGVAEACPPKTVFSAYAGRGICAFVGQGARAAAVCFRSKEKCPAGFDREHKATDPSYYCCPHEMPDTSDAHCEAQCEPLLHAGMTPKEQKRVYNNCRILCGDPNGRTECPDGHLVRVGDACN